MNKYWIWLSRIYKIGAVNQNKLLEKYKNPEKIWNLSNKELEQNIFLNKEQIDIILDNKYRQNLEKYIEYMQKNKIDMITIQDEEYPVNLKQIYDPPIAIYIKGNKSILNKTSIAIVGSRICSNYGANIAHKFAYDLSKNNIIIVSGLAKGIDSNAHKGTLSANKSTIAVVGCGLDIIYPNENKELFFNIIKNNGAIVSEYIVGIKPEKENFPARNRIISGLSEGVLIIEAREKSGALITADFALEQGKEVYAVPGNINSYNSQGTNELIKQGAKLVTSVEDMLPFRLKFNY